MDCDIIGFQEVFSQDALKDLVKELGFHCFVTVDMAKLSSNNPMKYVTTTVALASKYPITNIEKVNVDMPSIEKYHGVDAFAFSRVPIKAGITLPNGTELLVYVCHLKSNRLNEFEYIFNAQHTLALKKEIVNKALEGKYSKALKQRLCEASSLFFDIEKSKNKPTVLLCDLNDKEFSLTIDALSNPRYYDKTSKENIVLHDASHQYRPEVYNTIQKQKNPKEKLQVIF
jgi:endonuclease/exonuclease/phosphatase family metal-dependent hydrolase